MSQIRSRHSLQDSKVLTVPPIRGLGPANMKCPECDTYIVVMQQKGHGVRRCLPRYFRATWCGTRDFSSSGSAE